jgi:hypothetical protein
VRDLDVAQHEAAHVVVGCALGLTFRRAMIGTHAGTINPRETWDGETWFLERPGDDIGHAIMAAAGVTWDQRMHGHVLDVPESDLWYVRRYARGSRRRVESCIRAAATILEARAGVHRRVTRALMDQDLTPAGLRALIERTRT